MRLLLAAFVIAAALCASATSAFAASPSVTTQLPANIGYSSVTFNGDVNPNGAETKTYFEYGTTVAYGSKTAEVSVGSGASAVERSQPVSGLTPNVEYHYRIVATNASGTALGADRVFVPGWKVQAPASSTTIQFDDVSCSSPAGCTAVGGSVAQRWNGSEWKTQTIQTPAGGSSIELLGVSCVSSSACTAVGRYLNGSSQWVTLAEFWNGTEWKVQSTPNPASTFASLENVSCLSATDCTAVGSYASSGVTKTLAMRWDGSEWKLQTAPNPTSNSAQLTSVSCTSSSFCMATGFYYESPSGPWAPLSARWNGTEWALKTAQKPAGATMSWFQGVSCFATDDCIAVGTKEVDAGTHENQTMAQRWSGTEWKLQTTPNPEGTGRRVDDVSCVSATDCTMVGSYNTPPATEPPMVLRWDGNVWTLQSPAMPAGSTKALPLAVSCIASRGCQLVGMYRNASSVHLPLAEGFWRAAPPTATTKAATSVGETAATLNGEVNPNGAETKAYFEYGTTTSYGTKVAEASVGSGSSAVGKSQALSGLAPNTTYHYRVVANNENPASGLGADATFTTIGPPVVTTGTGVPNGATGEAATLNAVVDPNGQSTTYQFEYGTSSGSYTTTVPGSPASAGSGMSPVPVSYEITGLTKGTKYFFRVTATNASGKVNGSEGSFTTQNVPGATTLAAIGVNNVVATLQASIDANGLATKYWFEYGTTITYGKFTSQKTFGPEPEVGTIGEAVSSLTPNTLYHYRVGTENALGVTYGEDKTFTTTTIAKLMLNSLGKALATGVPLKAFSPNLKMTGPEGQVFSCPETEFSGTLTENPGAVQSVTTAKIKGPGGGGTACNHFGLAVNYAVSLSGTTLEYTLGKPGEGLAKLSKIIFVRTVGTGQAICEYEVALSGPYVLKTALKSKLTGTSKLLKASGILGYCPATETVSGEFSFTSAGNVVEAT